MRVSCQRIMELSGEVTVRFDAPEPTDEPEQTDDPGQETPRFDDVPDGHVFEEEIAWLASTGITQGRGDGTFGLNDLVTRGAMAAFLYRYDGEVDGPFDAPDFDDVPDSHVFADEIAWLASTGITQGRGDGTFGLNDPVTRGAMAAFLYRYDAPEEIEDPDIGNGEEEQALVVRFIAATGVTFSDASALLILCEPDGSDCVAIGGGEADADGIARIDTDYDRERPSDCCNVQWFATIGDQVCSGSTDDFSWPIEGTVEVDALVDPAEANWCRAAED